MIGYKKKTKEKKVINCQIICKVRTVTAEMLPKKAFLYRLWCIWYTDFIWSEQGTHKILKTGYVKDMVKVWKIKIY